IAQAIAFNYIMAIGLSYYFLQPNFAGQSLGDVVTESEYSYIFLALGLLLPTVFIVISVVPHRNAQSRHFPPLLTSQ
ncbi:hypothetical protein Q0O77_15160, partial [Staphylococcus aureus]|nr:hypothetical protein [Staphylococcus aureus]